jgi:hypothetical protein
MDNINNRLAHGRQEGGKKMRTVWLQTASCKVSEVERLEAEIEALLRKYFGPKRIATQARVCRLLSLEGEYNRVYISSFGRPPEFLPSHYGHRARFLAYRRTKNSQAARVAA